jgi:DNA/RNA-binding domain of Phe-tRNA-synthetase-like protein
MQNDDAVWARFAPAGQTAVTPKQIRQTLSEQYHINATEAQIHELSKHKNAAGLVTEEKFLSAFRHFRG